MHYTRDYTKSPAKSFDAVQDIIEYLGEKKYNKISPLISTIKDQKKFAAYCSLAGISGFPVKAWYEHYHGQCTWVYASDTKED